MPHPSTPALQADAENVAGPRSHRHGRRYTATQRRQGTRPVAVSANSGPTRLQAARPGKKRRKRAVGGRSGRSLGDALLCGGWSGIRVSRERRASAGGGFPVHADGE
jgi:hypothetical protein